MSLRSPYSDEELVRLLRTGDEHAFSSIYQRHWRRLYALAYHRLRSKQAAEDVVQEVLAGLWQRRDQTLIENLEAYLAAATRYAILRQLTKETQTATTDSTHISDFEGAADHTPDIRFLEQMMQKEINRLPEKCRLVFQYSRELGLSNKEIADSLQISQKAVEKHITKAIRTLRTQLKHFFLFSLLPILLFYWFC